jgi:hypothetical protein
MKTLVMGVMLLGTAVLPARAALVCATPQEMKLLQSAALQQQLMVAAMSCRMTADYNAFVGEYRDRLMLADQSLKAFFAGRKRGEDYNAYKARLAAKAAAHSERDPRFCDSARKVFDLALGRRAERNGLAPEPPQLIETGYEGCRPVDARLLQAAVIPRPRPAQAKVAPNPAPSPRPDALALAKPAPAAKPVVTAEALRALAPRAMPAGKPVQIVRQTPKPPPKLAPLPPAQFVDISPEEAHDNRQTMLPENPDESAAKGAEVAEDPADVAPQEQHVAALDRPRWRQPAQNDRSREDTYRDDPPEDDPPEDDPYAEDRTPYAYRPGAEWVWRETSAPSRQGEPRTIRVLGADGHWITIVTH